MSIDFRTKSPPKKNNTQQVMETTLYGGSGLGFRGWGFRGGNLSVLGLISRF